jgi:hypothetical protein
VAYLPNQSEEATELSTYERKQIHWQAMGFILDKEGRKTR